MKKIKLIKSHNSLQIWYICTITLVILYYVIGFFLNRNTYFKPFISIGVLIVLFINLLIIPIILNLKSIKKGVDRIMVRILLYLFSIICTLLLFAVFTIPLLFFDIYFGKDILYGDIHYESDGRITVEYRPWLERNTWIDVYKNKGVLFLERLDSYQGKELY
ncbi:hypothetical protein [Thomasclavelia sp.]